MKMSEFTYNLPEEKIAKFPPKERGTTNLLVLNRENGEIEHYYSLMISIVSLP
jgi:S-adenosylmethionine:tRNA ribosyltransferase-isomerase